MKREDIGLFIAGVLIYIGINIILALVWHKQFPNHPFDKHLQEWFVITACSAAVFLFIKYLITGR